MKIPQEFRRLASLMHQDIGLVVSSGRDVFDYLQGGLTEMERDVAAKFIDGLLASNLSKHELVMKWIEAGADASVHADDMVSFLTSLRARLRGE